MTQQPSRAEEIAAIRDIATWPHYAPDQVTAQHMVNTLLAEIDRLQPLENYIISLLQESNINPQVHVLYSTYNEIANLLGVSLCGACRGRHEPECIHCGGKGYVRKDL
jgi:hypothetical protein